MSLATEELGHTIPFNAKLLDMCKEGARICNQQWPGEDSPAATFNTIFVGIKNGLSRIARLEKAAKKLTAYELKDARNFYHMADAVIEGIEGLRAVLLEQEVEDE